MKRGKLYIRKRCHTCRGKEFNKRNPMRRKAINAEYRRRYKKRNWNWKDQLMHTIGQTSCQKCGINDIRVLSFHHRDPAQKLFKISWGWTHYMPLERLIEEARKCDVLCLNCHAIYHANVG